MSNISRRLPQSNEARKLALERARTKAASPGPDGNFLTASTNTRLTAMTTQYLTVMAGLLLPEAQLRNQTVKKNSYKAMCKMIVSHFLQVFNLGADRNAYPKGDRSFYGMDIEKPKLPKMDTDALILEAANKVVDGDAARVLAGGNPMSNPTAAEVTTLRDTFNTELSLENNYKETYNVAQENVEDLNKEADAVIKKVWDEVDTFYNEHSPSSKRDRARLWGVIYESSGPPTPITFTLRNALVPATLINGVTVTLLETGKAKTTNADGVCAYPTKVVGEVVFKFECENYETRQLTITIESGVPQAIDVNLQPL